MLTNFDIDRICEKLDLDIVGVFSKDELAQEKKRLGGYYINMQDAIDKATGAQNDGSHWTFFYIYSDDDRWVDSDDELSSNSDYKHTKAIYFDSFGLGMSKEVAAFLKPFGKIPCNNRQIQNIDTTECGWYCIMCHYVLEHKKHSETYLEDYERFLNMWNDDTKKNLTLLKKFMKPL